MSISQLAKISGDSILNSFKYSEGIVEIILQLYELDEEAKIVFESNLIQYSFPSNIGAPYRSCFLEIIELANVMNQINGIYVPSADFIGIMKEKRKDLNLAYGLKSREYKFLLSLRSSKPLASMIIKDLREVNTTRTPS